ncbi:hypothetical protein COPEUT_01655 [Coprococcus eutactus ATCC 27759]|nr:hypothetical protein COPEUT_01655 [Coprococcus eutactus ATCC 27759]
MVLKSSRQPPKHHVSTGFGSLLRVNKDSRLIIVGRLQKLEKE